MEISDPLGSSAWPRREGHNRGPLFVESCETWVQALLAMAPPRLEQLAAVWEKFFKEQALGLLGPWRSCSEMDEQFVRGQWRPIKSCVVGEVSKNRWRAIGNGRSSGHNEAVELYERIHTTSTDMGLAVAQRLLRLQVPRSTTKPIHCSARDMRNAFRQIARVDIHARFHILAAFHPTWKAWVFVAFSGLVVGIGAAVNHCNRVPAHFTAFARQWPAGNSSHWIVRWLTLSSLRYVVVIACTASPSSWRHLVGSLMQTRNPDQVNLARSLE